VRRVRTKTAEGVANGPRGIAAIKERRREEGSQWTTTRKQQRLAGTTTVHNYQITGMKQTGGTKAVRMKVMKR